MRILVVEARKHASEYAANQFAGSGHEVVIAKTFADAEARLRGFEGGAFDVLLTPQYAATGSPDLPNLAQTMEVSPLIELAAMMGVEMVGVLVDPNDCVQGRPNGFAWAVTGGRFSVGETRGAVFPFDRPPFAPKPWDRLLAVLQSDPVPG